MRSILVFKQVPMYQELQENKPKNLQTALRRIYIHMSQNLKGHKSHNLPRNGLSAIWRGALRRIVITSCRITGGGLWVAIFPPIS